MKLETPHIIFDQLVKMKIPALDGRGAENNQRILRSIAMNGPMLKYGIFKDVQIGRYSTVSRRVDSLMKRGYVREARTRATERGRQSEESMYGLTWRGFIASITIKEVRENLLQVLKIDPLLDFPEKESILLILEELITSQELETITSAILEAFLKTIPSLELIENEPMSLLAWFLSLKEKPELPSDFKLSRIPKDADELLMLLDKPLILKAVKERLIPLIRAKTREIEAMYYLFRASNMVADFISGLEVEDQPSKRLKEFMETELGSKLTEQDILPKLMELSREVG